jgi:hypothetical protein
MVLRNNADLKPWSVRESAVKLLEEYALMPKPAINDEINIDHLSIPFGESMKGMYSMSMVTGTKHILRNS